MRLYTILLYFLRTVLHVWVATSTSARCFNYSFNVLLMMDERIIRNM